MSGVVLPLSIPLHGVRKGSFNYLFLWLDITSDPGFFHVDISRSHSDTPHSVGLFLTSDRPVAQTFDNAQHLQETDIHYPGGIRTRNPSKRAAADPRFRPRGHRDRLSLTLTFTNIVTVCASSR
jgi:hypothetical protein